MLRILEVLPEVGAWTAQALGCAHKALSVLKKSGRSDIVDIVEGLLPPPEVPPLPRPSTPTTESSSEHSDDEPADDGAYGAVTPVGATALITALEQDRNMAKAEASAKVARIAQRQHVAKFAARYCKKTESPDKEEGTQCAAWMPCVSVAEVRMMVSL